MSATIQEVSEMEETKEQTPQPNEAETTAAAPKETETGGELELANWSVITFEGVAVSNLTYEEARKWLSRLSEQKISGLCIVTDEAAARMSK